MALKENNTSIKEGEFQKDWQIKTIECCCSLINGRGFKPFEWKKDGLPIIRIQNLNGSDEFNYYNGSYDKKIEVEPGELLFAWSGSRGTSFGPHTWKGEKGLLNYHTWKVVINEAEINKKYFFHALKALTKEIENNAHGASALVHTQKWVMEKLEFSSPSKLDEQIVIATALSDMDALITQTEKLIKKKKAIKQGMMQQLLSPYDAEGKIKEGWGKKKLGEVCDITMGQSPKSISYNQNSVGLPLIQGNADIKERRTFIRLYTSQITKIAKANDVIMTVRAPVGEVSKTFFDCCLGRGVCAVRYENDFIYHYLISIEENWSKYSSGSTFSSVNSSQINDLELYIPIRKSDQETISKTLNEVDIEINGFFVKLGKLKTLKQSMMQSLLTGKIRIYNPAYEPATQV